MHNKMTFFFKKNGSRCTWSVYEGNTKFCRNMQQYNANKSNRLDLNALLMHSKSQQHLHIHIQLCFVTHLYLYQIVLYYISIHSIPCLLHHLHQVLLYHLHTLVQYLDPLLLHHRLSQFLQHLHHLLLRHLRLLLRYYLYHPLLHHIN